MSRSSYASVGFSCRESAAGENQPDIELANAINTSMAIVGFVLLSENRASEEISL